MKLLAIVIRAIALKLLKWCGDDVVANMTINSVRIEALIRELQVKKVINTRDYEENIADIVYELGLRGN